MKTIVILSLLLISMSSYGMVGQSYQQMVAQFGRPQEFDKEARRARWIFENRGFELHARFDVQGECGFESYRSLFDNQKSKLRLHQLKDSVKGQVPRLKWRQLGEREQIDFASLPRGSSDGVKVFVSPVTPRGKFLMVEVREDDDPSDPRYSSINIFNENFSRFMD